MNLIVIQGEELVKEYEQSSNKIQFILKNRGIEELGNIIVKEFETEGEKAAYLQGFEDAEGWNKNYFIENERAKVINDLIKNRRIYIVRDDFYQEGITNECLFKIFAGQNAYERAVSFLIESANARESFMEFLKEEEDFRTRHLFWEIEEQTLEMWSADSIDVLENIQELGKYAQRYGDLEYKELEVDYGVKGFYFEKTYL